jgi:hypothetical protein
VTLGGTFGDGDEQILNFFVVDFHHGDHDFVLPVFIVVGCDAVEDLFAGDGDDSLGIMRDTLLDPYPTME